MQSTERKRVLVQTRPQSHLSLCLSVFLSVDRWVCPEGTRWQNGWLDLDAVWGGEWGRWRDGCIRCGCRSSKGKRQFCGWI